MEPDWFGPPRRLLAGAVALAETSDGRAVGVVQADFTQEYNERFGRLAGLSGPQCMVHKIAVLPTVRRSGTGRLLMHETSQEARRRRCTHMALMVDWSTPAAERVAFFKACGLRSLMPTSDDDLYGADLETVLKVTASA
ncbi:GNAT family N-acetyltransferase [Saccharothrix variisporea]|uniref:Acetyltransferase (GNAT) family protein n=1 Tax=Saccharothrix variisporea TaxID=543527 RepID=A0A495XA01_9PSEU|nr:GNAT family N-acetyltransferase [Saccharothrix variisporea]RKT69443.1 acetyltransferase (GNAT) family protein [Saccharothrix variisporea]